ncbi:MAG: winged helix-turn-helix domain-containing protein [Actinomycetota bacterium]
MPSIREITPQTARRLAIAKQRLAFARPNPTRAGILSAMRDLGCLQLDPITVVARSPLLVLWSRLGSFNTTDLDALLFKEKRLFEYWAHAASIVLTEDYPIHSFLMRRYPLGSDATPSGSAGLHRVAEWMEKNRGLRQSILATIRRDGPIPSRVLEGRTKVGWISSGWTSERNVAQMLAMLHLQGKVAVAGRAGNQKLWELAERWFPEWTPRDRLSAKEVVRRAAQRSLRALGVSTHNDIERHFTAGRYPDLSRVLGNLQREGMIEAVRIVEDSQAWPGTWFVHTEDLPLLDRVEAQEWEPKTTLLSPFDNLTINRKRTERLFGFHYRMEIYVPKAKRRYGYYVLPILHGDRFIGRLDPAMDRERGRLIVNSVHAEPDVRASRQTAEAIRGTIEDLARFLGASEIEYEGPVPEGWRKHLR